MSYTHVTPAWIAAMVPVRKSSFRGIPGSRMCTWGSMNPGRSTSLVPSSILSSPPLTRLPTETILPSSDMPIWEYLSSPSTSILPPMTVSMSSISLLRRDVRSGLAINLPGERLDPGPRIPPGIRRKAGLHGEVREVLRDVPSPFLRDLGQEQAPAAEHLDDEPVPPDGDLPLQLLRGGVAEVPRHREDGDLDDDGVELAPPQIREPGVVACGPRRALDGLAQGVDGHRVPDAAAEVVGRIARQRDECAAPPRERRVRRYIRGSALDLGPHRGPGQGHRVPSQAHIARRDP